MLIGADYSKKSIYKNIDDAERLEVTGESSQRIYHGLAIIPKDAKLQGDILFVETNMKLLKKYDASSGGDGTMKSEQIIKMELKALMENLRCFSRRNSKNNK